MNAADRHPSKPDPSEETSADDDRQLRMDFLNMSEQDAQKLRVLLPLFREFADEFVESFYQHLYRFEQTASFLQDEQLVAHLKKMQRKQFESMLEAQWDETYVEGRRQIGKRHADAGVEPQFFIGSYNQYTQHCLARFAERLDVDDQVLEWVLPLLKTIFFDIGLTLDAYFTHLTGSLRDALDMYWEANSELRQFARLASHDLKTPLATVANLCDEAVDEFGDQMPDEARELISGAHRRTLDMSRMIDELLSVSAASPTTVTLDEFSSQEAIQEAIDRVAPVFAEKEIDLKVPESFPYVWGNRVRLREAVYNLLSNAAKFIDAHPGQVEISVQINTEDCVFCISDNGPGIPHEELDRVFVAFRRLPNHRDQPGSGLGLYFTKTLVEQQGGNIWVESEVGQGTRFFLRLHRQQPITRESRGRGS